MRIKITEGQLEMIKSSLNEATSNKYNKDVNVSFNSYGLKYKGNDIDYIEPVKIRLFYDIEIDGRSWGIKDISLYSVEGPEELETEISFFVTNEDTNSEIIKLNVNWDNVELELENGRGIITIDDAVEVDLANDNEGNLMVKLAKITVFTL
jgi:hypothetical protein